jgi:Na+/proline symporter
VSRVVTGRARRPRWVSALLHLVLASALAADLWGMLFWARVGERMGVAITVTGALVACLLAALLAIDVRRQWFPHRDDG